MSDKESSARPYITVDPAMLSGEPCLNHTRIPVYMIAELVWNEGVGEAMLMWELSRAEVLVACWYVGAYGVPEIHATESVQKHTGQVYRQQPVNREWLNRWRAWAEESSGALWTGKYDEVTDPPLAKKR